MALWEAMTCQSHMESGVTIRTEPWPSMRVAMLDNSKSGRLCGPASEGCPSGMGSGGWGCTESACRFVTVTPPLHLAYRFYSYVNAKERL